MNNYIADEIYRRLVAALMAIEPTPVHDPASQVIEVLGEVGGVWPASLIEWTTDDEVHIRRSAAA